MKTKISLIIAIIMFISLSLGFIGQNENGFTVNPKEDRKNKQ